MDSDNVKAKVQRNKSTEMRKSRQNLLTKYMYREARTLIPYEYTTVDVTVSNSDQVTYYSR